MKLVMFFFIIMEIKWASAITADAHFIVMAGLTGLEPATSSVTGWHSNRLSYNPMNKQR